ncbi:MAG: DUF4921 family protein [Candidatus Aenigmarchaeota archaeon]|nr:DUF4921 family protein [Candidatus Aenigmarchaeota archaeon]
MGELRKDYLLDDWVIISPGRGVRPHDVVEEEKVEDKGCVFCPGNEEASPKEIGRLSGKQGWLMRWLPNKFPAVAPVSLADVATHNRFFTFAVNYGFHELVVETPVHNRQLWDFSAQDIERVLSVYCNRIAALELNPGIKYVAVWKNHGAKAGTSLVHSHSQILAQQVVPVRVQQKISAMRRFVKCPYCDIIQSEKNSSRLIFENETVVAFAPYASRFQYEAWVFPKAHMTRFAQADLRAFAEALQKIFSCLKKINASYNMTVTYAPKGADLHCHVEILPRLAIWSGFEFASGTIINSVSPEDAARFYRNE